MAGAWVALLSALVSCGQPPPPSASTMPGVPSLVSTAAAVLRLPGPAPQLRTLDVVAANAACESCHQEIAAEWRGSLHREAFTDPMFQAQFELEPFPFCSSCHAPEADVGVTLAAAAAEIGVGCITCHQPEDQLLAADQAPGHLPAPHPIVRTALLQQAAACAGCHEFAFPGQGARSHPLLMQSTVQEHRRESEGGCNDCHMQQVAGQGGRTHRDHRFAASRDETLIRSAVRAERPQVEAGVFRWRLLRGETSHAFPTGDLFRRLRLEIELFAEGELRWRQERLFTRSFAFERKPNHLPQRVERADQRLFVNADEALIEMPLRSPLTGDRLRYRLLYERVADPRIQRDGAPLIEGAVTVAEGELRL